METQGYWVFKTHPTIEIAVTLPKSFEILYHNASHSVRNQQMATNSGFSPLKLSFNEAHRCSQVLQEMALKT